MLVNKNKLNKSRVKFISYTGKYPNLCSGVLTLEIDGKQYKFGHNFMNHHYDDVAKKWIQTDEDPDNPNFNKFWHSGGNVTCDGDWNWSVHHGEWKFDIEDLPDQFKELASEIDEVFNENVEYGCCGGCI